MVKLMFLNKDSEGDEKNLDCFMRKSLEGFYV